MKSILLSFILLSFLVGNVEESDLQFRWTLMQRVEAGKVLPVQGEWMDLKKDGTYEAHLFGEDMSGKYRYNKGPQFLSMYNDHQQINLKLVSLESNLLTMKSQGKDGESIRFDFKLAK